MFTEKILPYILMVVFFAILPVTRLVQTEIRRRKDARCDEIKISAQVIDKRFDTSNAIHPHLRDGGTVYYASFRLATGDFIELEMGRRNYGTLKKGARGTLTYQGKNFLSFKTQ